MAAVPERDGSGLVEPSALSLTARLFLTVSRSLWALTGPPQRSCQPPREPQENGVPCGTLTLSFPLASNH